MSRQPFNLRWAQGVETQDSSTVFQTPDSTRQTTGWEGGLDKDAPPAGQENWWHNKVDTALQGVERNGVMDYHPQAIYGLGSPTYGSDGNYYESLIAGNTGNNPVSTSGFWAFKGGSFFSGSEAGDIKAVAHSNSPSAGWLKCNGAVISRQVYARLFSTIGTTWNIGGEGSSQFRLPDFRGLFLRGLDDGRGLDSGRALGSEQKGTFSVSGSGPVPDGITTYTLSQGSAGASELGMDIADLTQYPAARSSNPGNSNTPISLPSNIDMAYGVVRPRNQAVNYWIKY